MNRDISGTRVNNDRKPVVISYAAARVGRLEQARFEHEILSDLVIDAVRSAGLDKADVGSAVFTAPAPTTRQRAFATFMLSRLGLRCHGQAAEVSNLGITGGLAFDQACADVRSGRVKAALALGIEYNSGVDAATMMESAIRAAGDVNFQSPFGLTPIAWYALDADRYLFETGTTRRDLAAIAVKNRRHAMLNPLAQFQTLLTVDDVLEQPPIVEPLGRFDVPPRSDGAICLVITSEAAARELGKPFLRVLGRGFAHDGRHQVGCTPHDMTDFPAAGEATLQALEDAGTRLEHIDVAELYAPCTITEALVTESIGLTDKGKGAIAAADGETAIGGRIPVCTSGGCLSRGHPPGLTALYGIAEIFDQLTHGAGERQVAGAGLGLHMCELGNYNAALAHVMDAGN
ncbi:MAG: thiolase family protein [Gammaproteobacteria bacterium]|nr:thiolase family protein [Gammaproteobacteria bacterium]